MKFIFKQNHKNQQTDKGKLNSQNEKLSWYSLQPHLQNLRIGGFYQLDPSSTSARNYKMHQIYERFSLFVPSLYVLQEILYIYQVKNDVNKVMDSMFLMLSFADMIYKQIVLWVRADILEENLQIMKGQSFNQEEEHHKQALQSNATRARLSLRIFNGMTFATTLLWTMFPLIDYLTRKRVEFAIYLPFESNVSPRFYLVLFYVWAQTSLLGFNNSTMDILVTFLYAQSTVQLSLLRTDLENVVERSQKKASAESISMKTALDENFNNIIKHYSDIVRYTKNIERIFGGALLFQLLVTQWIICTTAYRVINMNLLSLEFLSMVFYLTCVLIEIFLFCYNGTQVAYESSKLTESAYQMNWRVTPVSNRRSLIIFMERAKRGIEPVGAINVPLSLNTFVTILRGSYTFYAFLKTTDH